MARPQGQDLGGGGREKRDLIFTGEPLTHQAPGQAPGNHTSLPVPRTAPPPSVRAPILQVTKWRLREVRQGIQVI